MNLYAVVVPAVLGLWTLGAYNRLVRLRNVIVSVFQAFAQAARERTELVQQLVGLARSLLGEADADHPELIEAVVQAEAEVARALEAARLRPVQTRLLADLGRCDHALSHALERLCITLRDRVGFEDTHADPEAQHPAATLLARLEGVLVQTDFARQTYNQAVGDYNAAIRLFPTTVIAGLFGFEAAPLLPAVPRGLA
ncbi:MAG: hypothetical protein RL722_113 [Pseudomonadota bacterium]|jgi:LemA protein